MSFLRHVGKMKNNNAKIVIVYRTLPGDSGSALVCGTNGLPDVWHNSLMSLVQDASAQQANELADILAVRRFPDGNPILEALHKQGHLKKVPTNGVLMTPTTKDTILLSELNALIAQQKGVSIDELAITDGFNPTPNSRNQAKRDDPTRTTSASVSGEDFSNEPEPAVNTPAPVVEEDTSNMSPAQLRSRADKLFKEAQVLRKQADAIDPPKSKKNKVVVDAE